ncbi:hypothetical protein ACP4OV_020651 [Aristida adscensionis]
MEPLSLRLLLPITWRPSLPLAAPVAAAPLSPRGLLLGTNVRLVSRRSRRRARLPVSPVAADTPRTTEEAAPSPWPPCSESDGEGAFDWLDQWYPIAPVCDLDPGAAHGKTVLGLSVVAWHDRAAGEWRVFDDACPHRLAPLSEGRIDGKGRLQCAYHGWCYDGVGACKFIPQAPAQGPPVHESSRACVASYPCVVQNKILWFYPRTEPEYKDVLQRKRPPYMPEIDDPSYVTAFGIRDLDIGYDILIENILDPAHLPYAHKGLIPIISFKEDPGRYIEHDQEGGAPIRMKIEQASIEGYLSTMEGGDVRFKAPCTFHGTSRTKVAAVGTTEPWFMLVAFCIPVAPGRSRLIFGFPTNSMVWLYKIIPRWFYHIAQNRVVDSDISLLHIQERKYAAVGLDNWQNACLLPTSSDRQVIGFRNWFRKYCKNQVGWATPQADELPPPTAKDKLLERYWSHVMQCTSCSGALKAMRALQVALQVASVAVVGFLAAGNGTLVTSAVQRTIVVSVAVLCFAASHWLANFIEKNFYFQDYVHAHVR